MKKSRLPVLVAAAAILVGALIPLAYLILELIPATQHLALKIGPNWSGIAAFAGSALAMISGSLLTQRQNVSREVSS